MQREKVSRRARKTRVGTQEDRAECNAIFKRRQQGISESYLRCAHEATLRFRNPRMAKVVVIGSGKRRTDQPWQCGLHRRRWRGARRRRDRRHKGKHHRCRGRGAVGGKNAQLPDWQRRTNRSRLASSATPAATPRGIAARLAASISDIETYLYGSYVRSPNAETKAAEAG